MAKKGENNYQYTPRKYICPNCGYATTNENALTVRQMEIYNFIKNYIAKYEEFPTFDTIGKRFDIRLSAAHDHVKRLVKKGIIKHVNKYTL